MLRRLLISLLIVATTSTATLFWLVASSSGLQTLARLSSSVSGGHLQLSEVSGQLGGPLHIGELRWHDDTLQLSLQALHLDWSPRTLLDARRLSISELAIGRLTITPVASDTPASLPANLLLPFAVDIENWRISSLLYGEQFSASALSGRFTSDGTQHRLDDLRGQSADIRLQGHAQLSGNAPFPLTAAIDLHGQLEQRPLALTLQAGGALEQITVDVTPLAGIEGDAKLVLTPFAASPLAKAMIQLRNIDPAAWQEGLPKARIDLTSELASTTDGVAGSFRINNRQPGPLDRQALPFSQLSGDLRWHSQGVDFSRLHATLTGQATVQGSASVELAARQFTLDVRLSQFDPSHFAATPAARINAQITADGRLTQAPTINARFVLHDSQYNKQPLRGRGQLKLDWPLVSGVDLQLALGSNEMTAKGAFGRPGEQLQVRINAPQLALPGLRGDLSGNFRLGGTSKLPTFTGELHSKRLERPGSFRLHDLDLTAQLAAAPNAPLAIQLSLARLAGDGPDDLATQIKLSASGQRQQHQLHLNAVLPAGQNLTLAATGGLFDKRWQGTLSQLQLAGKHQIQLASPAALRLAGDGWSLGPLKLSTAHGDWQATLAATATEQGLTLNGQADSKQSGQFSGQLKAAMKGPWQLAGNQPWQGHATAAFSNLDWLGELIGEGWQSAGEISGELTLAGTPSRPLLSGHLRGSELALGLSEQGLALADGKLDAEIVNNLLRVRQLTFTSRHQRPPQPLRQAMGAAAAQLELPGRLEISGEVHVDRNQAEGQAALDVRLERVALWQRADQWLSVSGQGRLNWTQDALGISGQLAVDAAYWQLAPAGAPRLSDDVVVKRTDSTAPPALRPRLALDLNTDLGRHFLFSGAGLNSRLSGRIRLSASGYDLPRANGTIRTRDGRFAAYGQQLEIEQGILTFQGLPDNPALDVRAVRKGLAVEAGVQLSGTAQKPIVRLISDPELPDAEKLSWLILGHGPENLGSNDATLLLSAAGSLLGNDSGNVVQQLKNSFGIDEFGVRQGALDDTGRRRLGSRIAGGSGDTSAATGQQILSVGKRLSNNATLSYEQSLGSAESIVKLSIALTRQISLVGRAGSDNAVDIFYTLIWGRPPPRVRAPAGDASATQAHHPRK
jgi:translocation and assembly module TamB